VLESAFASIGKGMARELATPRRRAFWAGWLTGFAACAVRGRPGPLGALLVAELAGQITMRAWQATEDLRTLAAAAAAVPGPTPEEAK
jgi:hypothetical protein